MYKIICLLFVCVTLGYADDRSMNITRGKMHRGCTKLITVTRTERGINITWNKNVSENENALRATYAIYYKSQNKIRIARSANLCTLAKKGSFEQVMQSLFLKVISNSQRCPIMKGKSVIYSTPFNYKYTIDKSGGCGEFRAKMKLFRKKHKTNLFPILTHKFYGTINGC